MTRESMRSQEAPAGRRVGEELLEACRLKEAAAPVGLLDPLEGGGWELDLAELVVVDGPLENLLQLGLEGKKKENN